MYVKDNNLRYVTVAEIKSNFDCETISVVGTPTYKKDGKLFYLNQLNKKE